MGDDPHSGHGRGPVSNNTQEIKMKRKTSELADLALNWAVATAEGEEAELDKGEIVTWEYVNYRKYRLVWEPSTNWTQGGPMIERERIGLEHHRDEWYAAVTHEDKEFDGLQLTGARGPTALIAAMRCFVASKLGDEIEVPNELG